MRAHAALVGLEELSKEWIVDVLVLGWIRGDYGNVGARVASPVEYSPQAAYQLLVGIDLASAAQLQIHSPQVALG